MAIKPILKKWGLWVGLPISILALLLAFTPWESEAETTLFIVGSGIWAIVVARGKLEE